MKVKQWLHQSEKPIYVIFKMQLEILTVGKWSLKPLNILAEDYVRRIHHYIPIQILSLRSMDHHLDKLKTQEVVIALDEKGKSFSSIEFAKWLENQRLRSVKNLVFFVGPAEGVSESIKKRADYTLSLSKMTLQHELALVVLLEQIYRACTILKGEPYHK